VSVDSDASFYLSTVRQSAVSAYSILTAVTPIYIRPNYTTH